MEPILANYSSMTPEQQKRSHAIFDDVMAIFVKHLDRPRDTDEGVKRLGCVEDLHDYVMLVIHLLTDTEGGS